MSTEPVKFSDLEGPERLLGTRLLEFELAAVLGAGGMSVVYRGTHRVTQQSVAIKILPPELATHDELKARFVEEARVLALLEHPNIVSLNNFVEAGGRLCLIMQFVDGQTFEKMIVDNARVEWPEVLRVGIEVCKALEYAHGQSVVHRDIKPSNILIRPDGVVKVTDFGIAKILGASRLTSTGQTMGTVRYMSPEQVRGKIVDQTSDIYSLAATLYEGLTGKTPFEGENQFEIMQAHLSKPPPSLVKLDLGIPAAVEQVLFKALEKDPKARFADAQSFRAALESVQQAPEKRLPRAMRASRRPQWVGRALALGLGLGVAAAAGGVLYFVLKPKTPPLPATQLQPAKKSAAPLEPHTLPGLALAVDQNFPAAGLRVQSVKPLDAPRLVERYQAIVSALTAFMAKSDVAAVQAQAKRPRQPLNLVVVSQATLDTPALWPGFVVNPEASYPSRYVPAKRTLFIADSKDFEEKELPYGVALHVLAPVPALTNDALAQLAERFQATWSANRTPH